MSGDRSTKRIKILGAAEELFAQDSFVDVTLRQIAKKAGVDVPILNYHFPNKIVLLEAVLKRRADELNEDRLKMLDQARKSSGNKSPDIASVVEALIYPFASRCISGGPEWSYYAAVLGQLAATKKFAGIIHELYDPVAQHFISAMRLALPEASLEKILWGYQFSVYSMVAAIANTGRMELISEGEYSSSDLQSAYDSLVAFVANGMRGLQRG